MKNKFNHKLLVVTTLVIFVAIGFATISPVIAKPPKPTCGPSNTVSFVQISSCPSVYQAVLPSGVPTNGTYTWSLGVNNGGTQYISSGQGTNTITVQHSGGNHLYSVSLNYSETLCGTTLNGVNNCW